MKPTGFEHKSQKIRITETKATSSCLLIAQAVPHFLVFPDRGLIKGEDFVGKISFSARGPKIF